MGVLAELTDQEIATENAEVDGPTYKQRILTQPSVRLVRGLSYREISASRASMI